ncbi:MAG: (2Fe-2S)-binding protein [Spirochaetaceae bacterium]|nr:MAG: (2Fe-2S)-binding protein [Spirochaetaceae bacterium]
MTGILRINGSESRITLRGDEVLLDLLRGRGHTEVKEGCREGACGSCLILLDGVLVNSCQVLAASALGREITTVKGLGTVHEPHPIQEAFVEAGAVQCGFCTPGMILATFALLKTYPRPTDEQIRHALDGNLCRCTGYVKIIEAVKLAAERMAVDG